MCWLSRLTFLVVFVASPLTVQAANILGVAWDGTVVTIDATTGTSQTLGPSGFSGLNSLAKNSSGTLFSVTSDPFLSSPAKLITIDPLTGLGTAVTDVSFGNDTPSVRALAFSSSDILYAINNGGGPFATNVADNLYTINLSTGIATLLGSTGLTGIQGLDFAPNGTLYGWDLGTGTFNGEGLVTVDPSTGAAADVDALIGESGVDIQSIAFASDGTLYGARHTLYRLNPSTGEPTQIGSGGYPDLRGIEVLGDSNTDHGSHPPLNALPEPASWILLGFGLIGIVGIIYRRKVFR